MSAKEAQQPLQALSPERVNATRPISTTTISTKTTTATTSGTESQDLQITPESSPTRRARVNLFADYSPTRNTPKAAISGFALPQSPSLPEMHSVKGHVRTNSDVQGLVKRFEHLDVRDRDAESVESRKRHEAELRRAQIAREEAESDVRRLRDEVRRVKTEREEGREREKKVVKRLDVVMEELTTAKASQTPDTTIYEKELRKARKEAFKSSSAVLKLQEELKSTRNTLRITQSGFDAERQKLQQKEQERFEMEYHQLIPLQEEVEKLTSRLKVVESEKEALKTTLQEEEVARVAAEGMIALPASQDLDEGLFLSSPRKLQQSPVKRATSPLSDDKENLGAVTKKVAESRGLSEELDREKMRRKQAEELVEFLRMECLFRCCGCHTASTFGHDLALELDTELAAGVEKIRAGMEGILTPALAEAAEQPVEQSAEQDVMEVENFNNECAIVDEEDWIKAEPATGEVTVAETSEYATAHDLDQSLIIPAESPKAYPSPDDELHQEEGRASIKKSSALLGALKAAQAEPTAAPPETTLEPSTPQTPSYSDGQTTPLHHAGQQQQHSIRTVTTTTKVPMHFTPLHKPTAPPPPPPTGPSESAVSSLHTDCAVEVYKAEGATVPATPRTFNREAALKAIEYRRGRAKSISNGHVTPRKQMCEGVGVRRDVSAPVLGQKGKGGEAKRELGGKPARGSVGRSARK